MKKFTLGLAALAATALTSTPAQAALVLVGQFDGNDCGQGIPFNNCWATQDGVFEGPVDDGSPAVYKLGSDDEEDFNDLFPSIDGSEFDIGRSGDILSFTYTPGDDDPFLHYFSVKQATSYVLFYDEDPITSGSVNLATYFPNNVGWSHITFYDTGAPGVPEPATWAMLLIGFGAIGATMRTKKSVSGRRLRIA